MPATALSVGKTLLLHIMCGYQCNKVVNKNDPREVIWYHFTEWNISNFEFSQGDGNIRYYEVSDSEPYFTFLNEYRSSTPQRGLGVMPKRGLDVTSCEIYRFYKLHNNNFVEPIAMTVPRRVSAGLNNNICWHLNIILFLAHGVKNINFLYKV